MISWQVYIKVEFIVKFPPNRNGNGNHRRSNLLAYSSILNVFTYLNDTFPSLWYSTSFRYIPSGVLPVGRPNTKYLSAFGLKSLMRFITYLAAHSPTQSLVSKMIRRILLDSVYFVLSKVNRFLVQFAVNATEEEVYMLYTMHAWSNDLKSRIQKPHKTRWFDISATYLPKFCKWPNIHESSLCNVWHLGGVHCKQFIDLYSTHDNSDEAKIQFQTHSTNDTEND